jgi:predicted Fe-Mo cluster-binding NifX family protein
MKIAAVTDDGITISAHFGRATKYSIFTVEEGEIVSRTTIEKPNHRDFQHMEHDHSHDHDHQGRGMGENAGRKHRLMFEPISDCQVLLARGMGRGAQIGLQQAGIQAILTDDADIEKAVERVIDGTIKSNPDRVH